MRVQRLDERTGESGMLAADPAHRGLGVGRELRPLRRAQEQRRRRLRDMQLELLVPAGLDASGQGVPRRSWYTRIGYRVTRTGAIDEAYPALAPLLATPCDFLIYRKPL